jgi:TP901 family phage tail tape measure protein
VKFAADFESAFAGVRKTVDATESEFGRLRTGILDLSSELPTSADALADIAANAGQLGIAKGDIIDFTRTAAQLGETTNLSAIDAATGLARFANVLGLNQDEINRTGSALVDLGNKGAATESEILDISQRLAAAGKTIGLSADQVLAFGEALSSVGIEAEAGGTAFSRVFIEIAKAVEGGGANLDRFAKVAGVSSQQFAQSFRTGPADAVATFVEGLGRLQASGEGTFGVLEELSLNDARLTRALLSAASAGDLFRVSLATGAAAFRENSALTREYEERLKTAQAQFGLLINELRRFAIETGAALLPAVRATIAGLRSVVAALNSLPTALKVGLALISVLGGALLIVVGTLGFFAGSVLSITGALATLGVTGVTVAAGMATFTGAIGAAAVALGGLATASLAFLATPLGLALVAIAVVAVGAAVAFKAFGSEATATTKAAEAESAKLKDQIADLREETKRLIEVEKERRRLAGLGVTTPDLDAAQRERGRDLLAQQRERERAAPTRTFQVAGAGEQFVAGLGAEDRALLETARLEDELTVARRERIRATLASAKGSQEAFAAETDALAASRGAFAESAAAAVTLEESRRRITAASQAFQEAQRNLDSVLADGTATDQELERAQSAVADALRETDAAADAAVTTVGAITSAQDALAFSASEAGKKQRELNQALFETAVASAVSANRPSAFAGADAEQEAAAVGDAADFAARLTGQAALDALQTSSRDAAARIAEGVAAATKAGRGGASILDRRKAALEGTEKRQREEQATAVIRERIGLKPGEKGLSGVQAEQARLDAAFSGIVDELAVLGFEVPEEFRDMFDRINSEAEDGSKKSGKKIGGLLGFLIARRFNQGLDPTAGIISQPAAVTASLTRGTPREAGVSIENVNIGAGVTTGDIQQGMGVAFRGAFGSQ